MNRYLTAAGILFATGAFAFIGFELGARCITGCKVVFEPIDK